MDFFKYILPPTTGDDGIFGGEGNIQIHRIIETQQVRVRMRDSDFHESELLFDVDVWEKMVELISEEVLCPQQK